MPISIKGPKNASKNCLDIHCNYSVLLFYVSSDLYYENSSGECLRLLSAK